MWLKITNLCLLLVFLQNSEAMPKKTKSLEIINGQDAKPNQFPYQVYLVTFWDNSLLDECSGTIISNRTILTAAQCVGIDNIYKARMVRIFFGCNILNGCKNWQIVRKSDIKVHPDYQVANGANDLALLYLPSPINFTDSIKPIQLDFSPNNHLDEKVTLVGYGANNANNKSHGILKFAESKVISNEECAKAINVTVLENEMCTGAANEEGKHVGVCDMADVGGPLISKSNKQIGIALTYKYYNCIDPNLPTKFTRISKYEDWIRKNVI